MRVYLSCIAGLALTLACALAATAAEENKNGAGQEPQPGTVDLSWVMHYAHPGVDCLIEVHYPQGLGAAVDSSLGKRAKMFFDERCAELVEPLAEVAEETRDAISAKPPADGVIDDSEYLGASGSAFSARSYELFRPSPGYASLLFTTSEFTGGAHGNLYYSALSFDLASGRELAIEDVFADPAKAAEGLAPLVTAGIRAQKKPGFSEAPSDPQTLDLRLGRMLLTDGGMRIVYAPYEVGSYAEGSFMVDIPKEALLRLGASPAIWK